MPRVSFFLYCLLMISVSTATVSADDAPGNMQLLAGYEHQALQGIDSRPGVIERKGGLAIHYEIGSITPPGGFALGGAFSDRPRAVPENDRHWYKEQSVAGQPVHLAYTKQNVLLVSYPKSGINFRVEVKNIEELTDALLMILTYRADKK